MVVLPVTLALRGEAPLAASLFMLDIPRHARAQLLDDVRQLLEEDREFLPVEIAGRSLLVNRAFITYVAVARRPPGFGDDDEVSDVHTLFDHRCPVALSLADHTLLRGSLLFSSSADHARLIDFVNGGPRFVQVWTSEALILVQRSAIRTITETGER
jgi:hypothetical protein